MGRFRFARTFENYFIKAIGYFFHVYIASAKHLGLGEFSKVMQTRDAVSNCPNPSLRGRRRRRGKGKNATREARERGYSSGRFDPFLPFLRPATQAILTPPRVSMRSCRHRKSALSLKCNSVYDVKRQHPVRSNSHLESRL